MTNTVKHTFDGPNKDTYFEAWYTADFGQKSLLHRENAPALIEYDTETNEVISHTYFHMGEMHNFDGPAWQRFIPFNAPGPDDDEDINTAKYQIPPPLYQVHGDTLELSVYVAHSSGKITDEELEEIQKIADKAKQLKAYKKYAL